MQADDLVAIAPVQPLADDRQAFRGVLDQRDIVRIGRVDEPCKAFAQALFNHQPIRVARAPFKHALLRKTGYDLRGSTRPRTNRGMVQVAELGIQRKLGWQIDHGVSVAFGSKRTTLAAEGRRDKPQPRRAGGTNRTAVPTG